jgi:hypothetical protein
MQIGGGAELLTETLEDLEACVRLPAEETLVLALLE